MCFGGYNGSWTICREQCNFNTECFKEKTGMKVTTKKKESKRPDWHRGVYGAGGGNSVRETPKHKKRKTSGWSDADADKHFRAKWGVQEEPQFRRESQRPPSTSYSKPKPKHRVFHMPAVPRTRLVFGSMNDINLAIMFGLYKYGEDVLRMIPSEIAEEYDRLQLEPDLLFKDQRIVKLRDAVSKHWSTWDDFIVFMNT